MSHMNTDRVHNTILVQSHHFGSSAEQTIVANSNPEAKVNERPLVVKQTDIVIQITQLMVILVVGVMASLAG